MCSLFSLFCYQEPEGTLTFALAYNFSLKTIYVLKRFWVVLTINLGREISLLRPWSFRAKTEDCSLSLTHRHSLNTYCQWSVVFSHHDPWAASDRAEGEHWSHNALSPMCQPGSRALNMGYLSLNPLRPPLCSLCPFYRWGSQGTVRPGDRHTAPQQESGGSRIWMQFEMSQMMPRDWQLALSYEVRLFQLRGGHMGSIAPVFLLPYMLDISIIIFLIFSFSFSSFLSFSLSHKGSGARLPKILTVKHRE